MSQSISNGLSVDILVQATHSLKLAWLGGTYTANIISGAANVPVGLATNSASDKTFGPYATAIMVRLTVSAIGRVAWDTASAPAFIPPGEQFTRQDDGIPVTLSGVGPDAAFEVDGDGNFGGLSSVFALRTPVTSTGVSTEEILAQAVIPAGAVIDGSMISALINLEKTGGTVNTGTIRIRLGKTGTTADPLVVQAALATTTVTLAYRTDVQVFSDGFRQAGLNTAVVTTPGASASALASKQTVAGMLSGPTYLTITSQFGAAVAERAVLSVFDISVRV